MARRHPGCLPSEATSLSAGSDILLKNWMTKVIKGNGEASIKIDVEVIGTGAADPHGQALLSFDYQCDYRRLVHLEPVCKKLEKELPGASRQLLDTLDEVNYDACDILTPDALLHWTADVLWYGEVEDNAVIQAYEEMNGEPLDEDSRFDMPSDYLDSLGSFYRSLDIEMPSKRRRRKSRFWSVKQSKALIAGKSLWVQKLVILLQRVRQASKALPQRLGELSSEFTPTNSDGGWRAEPSFALWWRQEDGMGTFYDQVVTYRMEGDSYQEEILRVRLDPGSAERFVTWIEAAAKLLSELDALYTLLGDQADAGKSKRQRVRK